MTVQFKTALWMQTVWFALAVSYNCFSLVSMANGGAGFAGDRAGTISALAAVVLFGAVTLAGFLRRERLFRVFSPLVVVLLLVGGVLKHLMLGPVSYASYNHWLTAIMINGFGVAAFAFGAALAFSHSLNSPE